MKRSKKPKVPGPSAGDDAAAELWESRMGIVRTFVMFAVVVTSIRIGESIQSILPNAAILFAFVCA